MSPVALNFEQDAAIGGDGWRIAVARKRRQHTGAASRGRQCPEVERAVLVWHARINRGAVGRERDGAVRVTIRIRLHGHAIARNGDPLSALNRRDARYLAARRPRGEAGGTRQTGRPYRRAIGRHDPKLAAVVTIDERRHQLAVWRPRGLAKLTNCDRDGPPIRLARRRERVSSLEERSLRAGGDIVDHPPGTRTVAVGEHLAAIGVPRQVTNLTIARRQFDDGASSDGADAKEAALAIRDGAAVGRHRANRIAVAHRPELLRRGHPRQPRGVRLDAPLARGPDERQCPQQEEDRERKRANRQAHAAFGLAYRQGSASRRSVIARDSGDRRAQTSGSR